MPPLLTVSQCSFRFSLQRFLLLLYHGNRIVVFLRSYLFLAWTAQKLNPTNNIPIRTRPVMVFLSILSYFNYKLYKLQTTGCLPRIVSRSMLLFRFRWQLSQMQRTTDEGSVPYYHIPDGTVYRQTISKLGSQRFLPDPIPG